MCTLIRVRRLLARISLLFAISLPTASIAQSALRQQIDTLTAATSLDREGIQPWHMRLSFDLLDQKGKPQESGTAEEWWAGPDRARLVITSPSFNQVLPGGDAAVHGRQSYLVQILLSAVLHPVPRIGNPDMFVSTVASRTFGQISLSCTTLTYKGSDNTSAPQYCTDPNTGDLRLVFTDGIRSDALNDIGSAINTQVAKRHTIAYLGQPAIKGHIESIEPFDPDHSGLQLGPLAPKHDATLTAPHLLTRISPAYPEAARVSGQSGIVVLHLRVLANGRHSPIDTIASSGRSFTQAALDAVGRWGYMPMKRGGTATESDATISLRFLPASKTSEMSQVLISEDDNP